MSGNQDKTSNSPNPKRQATGQLAGRNGVVVPKYKTSGEQAGYRTYEVYQRERVGQSTERIKPVHLVSDDFRVDPYPMLAILREHYPCYRDWLENCFWITRYDDVTSVFTDDANFETRSKAWRYDQADMGRDLGAELKVLETYATTLINRSEDIAARLAEGLLERGGGNLATGFASSFAMEMILVAWGIPLADTNRFTHNYWALQRGTSWRPDLQLAGQVALEELKAYFEALLSDRRDDPGDDLVSVIAQLELPDGPATAADVVRTLLEGDHETLGGALANLWYLLLTHPEALEQARSESRLMKLAYLETVRHSTPVLAAHRYTRHEVERFGRLLPAGALVICSAAAANRDPRVFTEPDRFVVDRQDMCHREPRGQYRADGLASGITFALGKPSRHPAVPEDRPMSAYALVRDAAVTASNTLLACAPDLSLVAGAQPRLNALSLGEMHTCWDLPVVMHRH